MVNTRIIAQKHQTNVRRASLLGSVALAVICTAPAYAATQIQLTSSKLAEVIPLTSYSQNASSNANSAGKNIAAVCGQVTITKLIDQSSPIFLGAVLSVQTFPDMTIIFSQGTSSITPPFTYYTVQLGNVIATSITQSDNANNIITEQIVLSASQFRFTFFEQKPDGTTGPAVSFGFDCITQTGS